MNILVACQAVHVLWIHQWHRRNRREYDFLWCFFPMCSGSQNQKELKAIAQHSSQAPRKPAMVELSWGLIYMANSAIQGILFLECTGTTLSKVLDMKAWRGEDVAMHLSLSRWNTCTILPAFPSRVFQVISACNIFWNSLDPNASNIVPVFQCEQCAAGKCGCDAIN